MAAEEERPVCHCGEYCDEHTEGSGHTAVPIDEDAEGGIVVDPGFDNWVESFDWSATGIKCKVERVSPVVFDGAQAAGLLIVGENRPITSLQIRRLFGGGRYNIDIIGPRETKMGTRIMRLGHRAIAIAGEPKIWAQHHFRKTKQYIETMLVAADVAEECGDISLAALVKAGQDRLTVAAGKVDKALAGAIVQLKAGAEPTPPVELAGFPLIRAILPEEAVKQAAAGGEEAAAVDLDQVKAERLTQDLTKRPRKINYKLDADLAEDQLVKYARKLSEGLLKEGFQPRSTTYFILDMPGRAAEVRWKGIEFKVKKVVEK